MLREKAVNLTPKSPWHCQKFYTEYRYFGVKESFNVELTCIRVISNCFKKQKNFIKFISINN